MTKKIAWGFLGAGGIADIIATDFQFAGLDIRAVATRDIARTNAFADKFNIPNRHKSYEDLVADPEVDAIYISTIHPLHLEHSLLAIAAGKHVLIEKPITLSAADTRTIQKAAQAAGVLAMEAMWTRFLPTMNAVFAALKAGEIGEPKYVYADHSQYLPIERAPRLWHHELGGGAHYDLGIYCVSFVCRVLGMPTSVVGKSVMTSTNVDEATAAVMTFDNGALATINSCMTMSGELTAAIHGTKGRIEIDASFYEQTTFRVYDNTRKLVRSYEEKVQGRGMQYQAIHFEECLAKGLTDSPIMSMEESVKIMEVMEQIHPF
jgi:predicted dehydrogenase